MRTLLVSTVLAIATLGGCSKDAATTKTEATSKVAEISVAELDAKLAKGACQAVDANGPGTRQKLGVIPGAVLLTDYEGYATSELPADKSKGLVFYCANTQCGASHEAAEKAIAAGYQDVKVLPAGIAGWRDAGKQTQQIGG